jgi:NADPH-dependent curcumin reductase CurA
MGHTDRPAGGAVMTSSSGNRQIVLTSRPAGLPTAANFALVESPIPEPGEHEILIQTLWLSLDPYMRGRMSAAKSYATPFRSAASW